MLLAYKTGMVKITIFNTCVILTYYTCFCVIVKFGKNLSGTDAYILCRPKRKHRHYDNVLKVTVIVYYFFHVSGYKKYT